MIEGLKLQMSSGALKELVEKRAEYHGRKAELLEAKAKAVVEDPAQLEMDEEAQEQAKYLSTVRTTPDYQKRARHHRDRATYFRFFAQYVIPNETYVLAEEDLSKLEVLSPW